MSDKDSFFSGLQNALYSDLGVEIDSALHTGQRIRPPRLQREQLRDLYPVNGGEYYIIPPKRYCSEILHAIDGVLNKARMLPNVKCTPDDVKVFCAVDSIFVIGNPILGKEDLYSDGQPTGERADMYNVTIMTYQPLIQGTKVVRYVPYMRIILPSLTTKIDLSEKDK